MTLGRSIWRGVKLLQIAMTLSPRNTCSGCSQTILHTGYEIMTRKQPDRCMAELTDQYVRDRNLGNSMPLQPRRGKPEEQPPEKKEGWDSEDHERWERPTGREESAAYQKNRLAKYFDEEKGAMCFNCREWGHIGSNCPKRVLRVQTLQAPADYLVQGNKASEGERARR